jgi:hypothetical protein
LVEVGRIELPSRTPFSLLHTAILVVNLSANHSFASLSLLKYGPKDLLFNVQKYV